MDKCLEILREYWGYGDFRGIQREIIDSISSGRDTLGLMPTGGGKSITFQVPALMMPGVCVVITPLIALMKDQVDNLKTRGIRAAAIYSGMMHADIVSTLENAIFGGVKILYVSPERLSSELFKKKLSHMKVSFITVDEAHCISQWGYDFRPSYLKISEIRKIHTGVPVLALTATATPRVVDDIQDRLGFKEKNVFRMSFERKNLAYIVTRTSDKEREALRLIKGINGAAIVYVRSRQRTKDLSQLFQKAGVSATFYNAGLENSVREARQKEWQDGKVKVMVATNAFGMGICLTAGFFYSCYSMLAKELVRNVFFSNAEQKELKILRFLLLGYQVGPQLCKMLAHPDVAPMLEAEKSLLNEVHLLKGFLRFSDYDGVLGAVIGPKHYVLPLLAPHFCSRFGNENFMIWDKTHKAVLYWANKKAEIFDMEEFSPPQPSASEQQYQQLWKEFYATISIAERENLPCRQNHCPKRYWQYMTEMQQEISKGHL